MKESTGTSTYIWHPTQFAVLLSLASVLIAGLVYYFSVWPTNKKLAVSSILGLTVLYVPLFITRVLLKGYNYINLQRTPIGTDSLALQYYAAKAFTHLKNPYCIDFKRVLVNHVNPAAYTWIYHGEYSVSHIAGFVTHYDYLPTGFLYYLPAAILHIDPNTWNILMMAVFIVMFYVRMRRPYVGLYTAVLAAGMFIYFFEPVRYTPDTGWLVPLLLAIMTPRRPRLSGFLLGWAVTYRPYVAVFLPFYLIALAREGYNWKKTVKWAIYTALATTLPFFSINPHAFIRGVLLPYVSNFSPFDSIAPGVIDLHFFGINISPIMLKVAMSIVFVVLLFISRKYYYKLKHFIFFLPVFIMIMYPRPSYVYYIYFPFVGAVAYFTVRRSGSTKEMYPITHSSCV